MKKKLHSFILCFLVSSFFGTLNAQQPIYQLPNNSFETWYLETTNVNSIVPVNFNSFYSASGQWGNLVAIKRCDSSRDVRPGATGTFSLHLFSSTILLIRANGNVTTGRINAGSLTANSPDNYNYSDYTTTPPKYYQEITGTPDSLCFWVKYLPGRNQDPNVIDKGRIRVYIHGTGECRDASQYPEGMTETQLYYGKAVKEFYKEDGEWHCYQVPFEYTGTNTQKNANGNYYVLLSMTTNSVPGGGEGNPDRVWFDDIVFLYNKRLADLKVDGVTIPGFNPDITTYNYFYEGTVPIGTVTAITQSPNNPVVNIVQATSEDPIATVTVTHGGESKIYTVMFKPLAIQNFTATEQTIALFPNPASQYITITASQNITITDVKIFDMRGVLMLQESFEFVNARKIDVASLHQGIYFIRIETKESIVVKRFIVK
jgi:hypothetical protein